MGGTTMKPETKVILAVGGVLGVASLLPVFKSGIRRDMNFWQWLWGHTIWGPPALYVPRELSQKSQKQAVGV